MLNFKDMEKYVEAKSKYRVKCKCGHTMSITNKYKREICSYCGVMNYLDKKDEFKANLKKAMEGAK